MYARRMSDSYAGIVEQWVRRVVDEYGTRLSERGVNTEERRKSNAFCALGVAALLELDEGKAVDCLTEPSLSAWKQRNATQGALVNSTWRALATAWAKRRCIAGTRIAFCRCPR